jgi:hypothetical protein
MSNAMGFLGLLGHFDCGFSDHQREFGWDGETAGQG